MEVHVRGVWAVAVVAQVRQRFSISEIRWFLAVVFSICFLSMEVDPCTPCAVQRVLTSVHQGDADPESDVMVRTACLFRVYG